MSRDITTGAVLENMIIPALEKGGYNYKKNVVIGKRPGGGKHVIDFTIQKNNEFPILISVKYQETSAIVLH